MPAFFPFILNPASADAEVETALGIGHGAVLAPLAAPEPRAAHRRVGDGRTVRVDKLTARLIVEDQGRDLLERQRIRLHDQPSS